MEQRATRWSSSTCSHDTTEETPELVTLRLQPRNLLDPSLGHRWGFDAEVQTAVAYFSATY